MLLLPHNAWSQVAAHVTLNQSGNVFEYTVVNDAPSGSSVYISRFHLEINAPITSVSSPTGWRSVTNNKTYVDWFSTDGSPPYAHDIAAGTSRSGFTITSSVSTSEPLGLTLGSWIHQADMPGAAVEALVAVPSTHVRPHDMADLLRALRIGGGVIASLESDWLQLDASRELAPGTIDISDAVQISRKVAGLD